MIQQSDFLKQKIVRNRSCIKEHRDGNENVDRSPPFQFLKNQRIRTKRCHCQGQKRKRHCQKHRPPKSPDIGRISKHVAVCLQIGPNRPQIHLMANQGL